MNHEPKVEISADLRDGLENLIAGLGGETDKRAYSNFVNHKQLSHTANRVELEAMYRTDWLTGKIVDILPDDMTREWREFTGDLQPEMVQILIEEEERLGLRHKVNLAHKWSRLYGTSFLVLAVEDGLLPEEPLELDRIQEGGLKHINVIDRHRVNTTDVIPIADPLSPSFGFPEFYRINETSVRIHHSRVVRFDAVPLPFDEFRRNNYFSDGVIDRLYDSITNFHTVSNSSASMVYEANVDIVQIKGLMNYLQTAEGESILRKRFSLSSTMKSFNNMMLLDSEENHVPKSNQFSGLPDLYDRYAQTLSAASDISATRLLGTSASGMNATGEGDLKNYYDKARSLQMVDYKPKLDYIDAIMGRGLGFGEEVELTYDFKPLFQLTPQELAETTLKNAQRDEIYVNMEAVPISTITKDLKQDEVYTNIDDEYIEELEEGEDGVEFSFVANPEGTEDPNGQSAPGGGEKESASSGKPSES